VVLVLEALSAHPSGLTPIERGHHYARTFIGSRCVLGRTLVVPFEVLFLEYRAWIRAANGWVAGRRELREVLDGAPWAKVVDRPKARGHLKAVVMGVGVAPMAPGTP
jgi:hypothetical protein